MARGLAVGLDIGTSSVRAAQLALGRGPAKLERFGQVALPPGAVRGGEVVDVDVVSAAVRRLWTQTKFRTKKVVVGVANQKVIVRQVELPWQPLGELKSALTFQVQDFIPMPVEQAILDVHPLEEFPGEGGQRMLRVLLVAAARDMVSTSLRAVQRAGLTPVLVDLTPFAVLRSLAPVDELGLSTVDAEALLDIGANVTNIVVHQGGVPRFVRILLMGGGDVTEAVADRMGLPVEEAELVKQDTGLAAHPDHVDPQPASRAIESSGASFIEEVRGSLDYYLAQPTATRIRRVVLSGGGSRLTGLPERLAQAVRLPVEAGSPLPRLRLGRTGLTEDQLSFVEPVTSVPVGLALATAS